MYARIRRGASGRGLTAVTGDGSSFFIPKAVSESYGLATGQELTEEEYLSLEEESVRVTVKAKALDLLAMRDHSIQEMRMKLLQREYPEPIIAETIDYLIGKRYLDDARFAEIWIRSRLRKKPESRKMLLAGLMQKGVDSSLAQEALDAAELDESQITKEAVGRYYKRGDTPEKLMQRLARKGFSYGPVKHWVDELFSEMEE